MRLFRSAEISEHSDISILRKIFASEIFIFTRDGARVNYINSRVNMFTCILIAVRNNFTDNGGNKMAD